MVDLSYEAFQKGKLKSSKSKNDLSYSTFLANKNKVAPTIKERLTGTPTKQKDGTFKANTGILPFLSEIPKTFVSGTVGTGKILGESKAVNSGAFDALNKANLDTEDTKLALVKRITENKKSGKDNTKLINEYNRLNPSDSIQSLAPNSQVSNLEALGNIGMMATEATGLSSIARSGKAFGYLGKEAEKQFLKTLTKKELQKRLIAEVAFNTAQGYGTDVAMKAQRNEKDFKPGLGTALGFGATLGIGNQQLNKTLNEQSAARIAEKQAQTFNIPEAGTPPVGYFKALPERATPPRGPVIELPEPGILKAGEDIRNPKPTILPETPKSPIIKKAESFNSRQDFINSERAAINRSKEINKGKFTKGVISEIPTTTDNQLGKIWDEAHATPKQPGTPPIPRQVIDQPVTQPSPIVNSTLPAKGISEAPSVKTTPETPQPKQNIINENIKTKADDTTETIKNSLPEDEALKVDSITLKDISNKSTDFINVNGIEKARRIALGIDPEPFRYGSQGIHAELANYARKTGDGELLAELAKSDVSKEAAQKTGIGRLKEPDNPYYIIKDINNTLKKDQNIITKMDEKSKISTIVSKLREKISKIELSTEELLVVARKLICD